MVLTKSGTGRRAVAHAFHPAGQTVYRVAAVDAAGNVGKPSRPFVVVPAVRPQGLPRPLPRWAWDLFTWQHTHSGKRPATAPKQPPAWYWSWAAWRGTPYHLRSGRRAYPVWPKLSGNTTRPRIDGSYAASGATMNAACQAGCGGSIPSSSDRRKPNRT